MFEKKSIVLSSNYRSTGSLSNPEFILKNPIANIHSVKLKSAMIPLTFYNIDTHNNKLYLVEQANPSTTITCTISPGNYTSTTILTALKSALELEGEDTYTVTFDSTTNKLTIAGTDFKLVSGSNNLYYELGIQDS